MHLKCALAVIVIIGSFAVSSGNPDSSGPHHPHRIHRARRNLDPPKDDESGELFDQYSISTTDSKKAGTKPTFEVGREVKLSPGSAVLLLHRY